MDHLKPHPELYNVPWTTDQFNEMPYRLLGKSGLRVSSIGLGTWKIGYPETGDGSRVDEKLAFQIFDKAVELGVTFWDTANRYNDGSGNSERIIGKWLKKNPDQRRNIILTTKIYGGMDGISPNHSRLSRNNILDSVYASLERLQLSYIDLLYFHAFDSTTPVEESLTAIEDLVMNDKIRYFGVSNFTVEQIYNYQKIQKNISIRSCIAAVQNQFDIIRRESSSKPGVLKYASYSGISFIAWGPLRRGLLTDRYLNLSKVGSGDRLYDEGILKENTSEVIMKKLRELNILAEEWDLKLNQLVIAYMLTLPGMGPVIPSVSSVKQLESNAASVKINFKKEQINRITKILKKS
jgi:aryl-alcohol dehydrogenase-like predicted oxidoreductase